MLRPAVVGGRESLGRLDSTNRYVIIHLGPPTCGYEGDQSADASSSQASQPPRHQLRTESLRELLVLGRGIIMSRRLGRAGPCRALCSPRREQRITLIGGGQGGGTVNYITDRDVRFELHPLAAGLYPGIRRRERCKRLTRSLVFSSEF